MRRFRCGYPYRHAAHTRLCAARQYGKWSCPGVTVRAVGSAAVGRYGKSEIPRATARAVARDIPVRVVATILRWNP
jgi:hypothetical protein